MDEIVNRLGLVPSDWSVQICCYCNLKKLKSTKAQNFFYKIKKKYKIKNVYFEYYPVYEYKLKEIYNLNNFYKSKNISIGLIGYQNFLNRVFTDNDIEFLKNQDIMEIDDIYMNLMFGEEFMKSNDKGRLREYPE